MQIGAFYVARTEKMVNKLQLAEVVPAVDTENGSATNEKVRISGRAKRMA